jgi:subtilisin
MSHDPVYRLPPDELEPEKTFKSFALAEAERRDYWHALLGVEVLHGRGVRGAGEVVAVLDTGADSGHPDLSGRIVGGKDFTGGGDWGDYQGHGTHVAGLVAASLDGEGVIGAGPELGLWIGKVLDNSGSGRSTWIEAGIRDAVEAGAGVISMSLGGPGADTRTREAIRFAISRNVWVFAAAGNTGKEDSNFPGHYAETVAVAASDRNNRRAEFSTINAQNDIIAPGASILSAYPGGKYATLSGTSMATPIVAGLAGDIRAELKRRGLPIPNQMDMAAALKRTARDLGPAGPDAETGAGLIDPAKFLEALLGAAPPVVKPNRRVCRVVLEGDVLSVAVDDRQFSANIEPGGKLSGTWS